MKYRDLPFYDLALSTEQRADYEQQLNLAINEQEKLHVMKQYGQLTSAAWLARMRRVPVLMR